MTRPDGPWAFDAEVADVFENMLERSIPEYREMRRLVFDLACRYVQPQTAIVDLGCSRGDAMAPLLERFGRSNRYTGVEISTPMRQAACERFAKDIAEGIVQILPMDLREEYPPVRSSVTLAVLALQFTPIEYRQQILRRIHKHTCPGGVLLLVEKVLGATAEIDKTLVDVYYARKRDQGYTEEQIERKRLSLEGVLVPVTARWNEEFLVHAGFTRVDCFWRCLNFAGWIAVKT